VPVVYPWKVARAAPAVAASDRGLRSRRSPGGLGGGDQRCFANPHVAIVSLSGNARSAAQGRGWRPTRGLAAGTSAVGASRGG